MHWRFYTEQGTLEQDVLETALSDYENDVGIVEFVQTFRSLDPTNIYTFEEAMALKRLLDIPGVQIERVS